MHLRLDTEGSPATHPDDSIVTALISASREVAEEYTDSAIGYADYTLGIDSLDSSDDPISLKTWPVSSVTAVQYYDRNGDLQTLASSEYRLDNQSRPAQLVPVSEWPELAERPNAFTVTFEAGYTYGQSPDDYPLPYSLKAAMLLILAHLYENRQDVTPGVVNSLPMGSQYLMHPYRIRMGL